MSESKKGKYHSPEFKAKVGLEAVRGVKTINGIGQEYGVHPVQVGQWKKGILEQVGTLFEGRRDPKPVAQEPERLHSEIVKLKRELDWLKKSPRSACHDPPRLDQRTGSSVCCTAMCCGGRFARHDPCAAQSEAHE